MGGLFGLGASVLAGLAGVVANQDGDTDVVPFFVALTVAGGVHAWATATPLIGGRRILALGITGLWMIAGGLDRRAAGDVPGDVRMLAPTTARGGPWCWCSSARAWRT